MAGTPLQKSETETPGPWGSLQPGEVRDTLILSPRCRWPMVDESLSMSQRNSPYTRPDSA